jgi:hypothetical protein
VITARDPPSDVGTSSVGGPTARNARPSMHRRSKGNNRLSRVKISPRVSKRPEAIVCNKVTEGEEEQLNQTNYRGRVQKQIVAIVCVVTKGFGNQQGV